MYTTVTKHLDQGYPICDSPGRVMRLALTFINYIRTVKIAQNLSRLSVPLNVTFTCAAHIAALCDGCDLLPKNNFYTSNLGIQIVT
jgi:hypothetical protein